MLLRSVGVHQTRRRNASRVQVLGCDKLAVNGGQDPDRHPPPGDILRLLPLLGRSGELQAAQLARVLVLQGEQRATTILRW